MTEEIEEYCRIMERKGYSKATIVGAVSVLRLYGGWLGSNYRKRMLEASREEIEEYITYLREKVKLVTVRYKVNILKAFYRCFVKEGDLLVDPMQNIENIRVSRSLPKDIPDKETIKRLLGQARGISLIEIRDRAIMEIMYSSGLRMMEVIGLDVRDVDTKEGVVHVRRGKGGGARIVPIGKKAREWAGRYLEKVRPRYSSKVEDEPLFITKRNNRIKKRVIYNIYRKYSKGLGFKGKITSHIMRHACALHMIREGAPIERVQELLGHKSLESTQIYTRLNPEDLKIAHQRYHPRGDNRKVLKKVREDVS